MAGKGGKAGRRGKSSRQITIALSGDVMTGRGIDQILPRPCDPRLHESYVKSALDYVAFAERANGKIPYPVDPAYIWGDVPAECERIRPDAWVVNLETSVTRCENYAPKGINYRMSPENAACLATAGIDCCVLANNHVLDWGRPGLVETLETLNRLGLKMAGAGLNDAAAAAPAAIEVGGGRVIVFAFGVPTSGIPLDWAATAKRPGVNLFADLFEKNVERIAAQVAAVRRPGDIVVASIHWGGNWGYAIPPAQRRFARQLIDMAHIDVVHGHSSHHPKGIEIHRGRPILYGCGNFITDYEGIRGYEAYRDDLVLLYAVTFDTRTRELKDLEMAPFQIKRFSPIRATLEQATWLSEVLDRESAPFNVAIECTVDGWLTARWR